MSTDERSLHEAPRKKRPSIFWWTLAHLLAIAFAAAAWTTCLYVFNYPEKPGNYEILRKLGRLTPVTAFAPLEAPEGSGADPEDLYKRFFPQAPDDLAALNLQFRRNYIRNYRDTDPRFTIYVEGEFQVESIKPLSPTDFFHPGLRVRAQARVRPDELSEPGPYPVFLDLLLPGPNSPENPPFAEEDLIRLEHISHRATLLHAARTNIAGEPAILATTVPLAYANYRASDGSTLPLSAPASLNLSASIEATSDKTGENQ